MKLKKLIYLERILRFMAKAVLWKYKPKIVGITGSVGKTSSKEAIFIVLSSKFKVRKNEKNYNNEIGIPLTIIGAESGNKSVLKWTKAFLKWLGIMIFPVNYPEILVLEMGIDRPGDMEYLLSFVRPTVGVLTNVSGTHLEFFKSIGHILKEKGRMIVNLPKDGLAVINADDEGIFAFKDKIKVPVSLFGIGDNAELKASDLSFNSNNFEPQGISFKLNYKGKTIPIRLPFILAPHLIYSALSAVSAGIFFKINIIDIAKSLERFTSPRGRMKLVRGSGGSFIIDDTYNSSPTSALAALDTIGNLKAIRKIIAFGDMLELGRNSESGHEEVLVSAFRNGVSLFFLSGDRMRKAMEKLETEERILAKVFFFDTPESLGMELRKILREGDLVLVKGSQGARMEKAVREMMANPEEAESFLCRQSKDWRRKSYLKP
jgi:UDP-N-acetylmuramoyl-tripeptide--D-alanyl-D-alanine ligase